MQHGVRTASPLYQTGAMQGGTPLRHGIPGQTPSYVAPPQGQTHSYVAPPQGNSYIPPVNATPAEPLPQFCLPHHGPPQALRRGVSPPPGHMALAPSVSRGQLEVMHSQPVSRGPALRADPLRPAAVSDVPHGPLNGMSSTGGYADSLQQEFREQRQHANRPAKSPVQDSREPRANTRHPIAHPERMRSARGSHGHEVSDLRHQLAEKEAKCSREEAKCEELKAKAKDLQAELKDKKHEIRDLKDMERRLKERLEDREKKIMEREARVADREAQLQQQQQFQFSHQAEREKEIAQREARLADREAQCSKKESQVAEKESQVAQELEEVQRELDERDAIIRESEKQIDEKRRILEEDEERFRTRERLHLEACKEAQVLRTTRRPSPRNTGNKENTLTKQLEEQREIAHGIKQHGWKQQKPEVDGLGSLKSAGTGGIAECY